MSYIIEEWYVCKLKSDDKVAAKAEKIIDEAIDTFDTLIEKLNKKGVEDLKKHFKSLNLELRTKEDKLLEKLEKLKV